MLRYGAMRRWSTLSGLSLAYKCSKAVKISQVAVQKQDYLLQTINYLGVMLDDRLHLNAQVEYVAKKASGAMFKLQRMLANR
uniref:Uncharacterized protein n=1 Tax=Anopheles arabiensis TaxID=7173 RepID=A0A182HQU6_ANOAR